MAARGRRGSPSWRAEVAARDPPPRRGRRRDAAAVRGGHGGALRRDDRGRRRRGACAPSAPPRAGTRRSTNARRASSRRTRRPRARRTRCATTGASRTWSTSCRPSLATDGPMSTSAATRPAVRAPPGRRDGARAGGRVRRRRIVALLGVAVVAALARDRPAARRGQGGAGARAPAAPRGHHPPAGGRQGPGPVARRRGHLRRVALPRRRRRTPARAGLMQITPATARLHRAASPAARSSSRATSRRRRSTSPTAPLPALPAGPLRRQRGPRARRLQRRRGQRRQVAAGGARRGQRFTLQRVPFAETREYVRRVLDARADYRKQYRRELGL